MPFAIKPPSPSISEKVFEAPGFEDDEFVNAARGALQAGRVAAAAAQEIATATHQNPMLTEPAQHRAVKNSVHKATYNAVAKMQTTIERLATKIATLDNVLAGPPAGTNQLLLMEVRIALGNMSAAERRKTILANLKDKTVACAVLRCPAFIATLSEEEQQDFRLKWAVDNHPTEVAQRAQIQRALEHLERAGTLLVHYTASLYSHHLIETAEAAERRAAAATAAAASGAMH